MTVAIRIAGIAHTPLATHPCVASPHDSPSAEGGGSYRRGLVIVHHCGRSAMPPSCSAPSRAGARQHYVLR